MADEVKDLELDQDEVQDHKEISADDLKVELAELLGFDQEEDAERLEKAVQREMKQREMNSKTIKQKIKYRDELKKLQGTGKKPEGNTLDEKDFEQRVEKTALKILENRDLAALNLPEELEKEVKEYAEFKGISVTEAVKLPLIQTRKKEIEQELRITGASPSRGGGSSYSKNADLSQPPDRADFPLTPEGSDKYQEARKAYIDHQKKA